MPSKRAAPLGSLTTMPSTRCTPFWYVPLAPGPAPLPKTLVAMFPAVLVVFSPSRQ